MSDFFLHHLYICIHIHTHIYLHTLLYKYVSLYICESFLLQKFHVRMAWNCLEPKNIDENKENQVYKTERLKKISLQQL